MNRMLSILALAAVVATGGARADAVDERLTHYESLGAGPFDAAAGAALWRAEHRVKDEPRQCADCHGSDLSTVGRHRRTGKAIEPMAASVNPDRFVDARKIEKWFLRNCKWTLGRPCSAQEKGDLLTWLRGL